MIAQFLPTPSWPTLARWREIGRGGLGAFLGLLVAGVIAREIMGGAPLTSLLLIAPIGASAVLVFAVPASPLAQPHSVVFGNVLSALVGLAVIHLVHNPLISAPLAVGLAIIAMSLAGCLHPPGGAVALICGLGGPEVTKIGWMFALSPVGLDSVLLAGAGLAYHRLTGHAYPHRPPAAATPAPPSFTPEDLDQALEEMGDPLDVDRADLEALVQRVEAHAHAHAGPLEAFVRAFLSAIARDEVVGREDEWYVADAVQVELPNRLAPNGVTRDLAGLKLAGERGRAIVERQAYEVVGLVESGDQVAVEAVFRATFKTDLLGLPKGREMTARFAMFFQMRDGKIARHHSYDCFEPW